MTYKSAIEKGSRLPVVEVVERSQLTPGELKLIANFRNLPTEPLAVVGLHDDYTYGKTSEHLPQANELDQFARYTGESQPSFSNMALRSLIEQILALKFPSEMEQFDYFDFWKALKAGLPKDTHGFTAILLEFFQKDQDPIINVLQTLWHTMKHDSKPATFQWKKTVTMLGKLIERGDIANTDIIHGSSAIVGWKYSNGSTGGFDEAKQDVVYGHYFSRPFPVIEVLRGDFQFRLLLGIMSDLASYAPFNSLLAKVFFSSGMNVTYRDMVTQMYRPLIDRIEILKLTEFTDPSLMSIGDIVVRNDRAAMTLNDLVREMRRKLNGQDAPIYYSANQKFSNPTLFQLLVHIEQAIRTWDEFVTGESAKKLAIWKASPNPIFSTGASSALAIRQSGSDADGLLERAIIVYGAVDDMADDNQINEADADFALIISKLKKINIDDNVNLLKVDVLKKITRLREKKPEYAKEAFRALVKVGISKSSKLISQVGIATSSNLYGESIDDPTSLISLVGSLKDLMSQLHPDRLRNNQHIRDNRYLMGISENGHLMISGLYLWYKEVLENIDLLRN